VNARQWLVAALVAIWSLRLVVHIAIRTSLISDDPRYTAFAREWGADSPRRMFIFLQNQALGSIPLVFAIFVAAHVPQGALRLQDDLGARPSVSFPPTRGGSATSGFGAGPAIPIISSSGFAGSPIP
jgi:steroid 5-alpha reductase family enzyme